MTGANGSAELAGRAIFMRVDVVGDQNRTDEKEAGTGNE
jgi:hypothetical protein